MENSIIALYVYNRLGQMTRRTDQRGVVRDFLYDKLARLSDDCASSLGGSSVVDGTVRRISRAYQARGVVDSISSYDNATVGSGNLVNQLQLDYNEFTQLITEWQAHSSSGVSGSTPKVQYAYADGGSSSNQIRSTRLSYPNGRVINYDYGSASDDDRLSRVTNMKDGVTALSGYTYLGTGTVIRVDYAQPGVRMDLWGGTSGTFTGIDLFRRVIDQRWVTTGGSPTDKDRYKYGYDRNSNRQWRQNVVGSGQNLDEYYSYDNLNRLTVMQRGTLTGSPPSGISGTPVAEQDWTLDPIGNWNGFAVKASGSTTLDQSRTQNKVNEITAVSASTGITWATPAYDAAGNMTTIPQPTSLASSYGGIYDAWDRLVQIKSGATTIATYGYDGRNRRITVDTGVVRHFYFTNSWQNIEERLGILTTADRQYVWGIRYIDELVCGDGLASSGSSSSSSNSSGSPGLTERLYATQDANFNVTSLLDPSAAVAERYAYDPYGAPTFMNSSWTVIGTSAKSINILWSGYLYLPETGLYLSRYRHFHTSLGYWLNRDPIDYATGGFNLYQYVLNNPMRYLDPYGLAGDSLICLAIGLDPSLMKRFSNASPKDKAALGKKIADSIADFQKVVNECCKKGFKELCNTSVTGVDTQKIAGVPGPIDSHDSATQNTLKDDFNKLKKLSEKECIPVVFTDQQIQPNAQGQGTVVGSTIIQITPISSLNKTFGIVINLNDSQTDTLAHEVGHYCDPSFECRPSPGHSNDPKNIMAPGYDQNGPFRAGDDPDDCYCKNLAKKVNKV